MSENVVLLDTSILCEILAVPKLSSNARGFQNQLKDKIKAGDTLLLPMTSILETGNHIGQCSMQGQARRKAATAFVKFVTEALKGDLPFRPTPFFQAKELATWLVEFPDWAMRSDAKGKGSGLGDLTIQKEWMRQCDLNPGRRVYIWSLDQQLHRFDRLPTM
ncbi:hypothetical protein [Corallococcus macrosporus]|uniref:PIN domain-containing protein n=1 Tax=Corallococcus macrosporus DSM 14697 TaxID=1189310 RepID=A0A250JXC3_9BACT|nr:hypothetical protein [Corallococcus macrosporus]ATB48122.1 hypothetical protein MYMAC_003748 [Corallococcus macrosporus DSM 14697]